MAVDVDVAVEDVMAAGLSPERQREGFETVRKLVANIQNSPGEEKYRRVNKLNPAIQNRLAAPGFFTLLRCAGFEDDGSQLTYHGHPGPQLEEVLAVTESLLLSLGGHAPAAAKAGSTVASKAPAESKRAAALKQQERAKSDAQRAQAGQQEQLAALRQQRAGRYQEEQDQALAQHLSGRNAESPYDPIAALNASRGAYSFVSCTRCGSSLRYGAGTRAQAVLCPCGALLQPIHLQGQHFRPQSLSDLPVEPGEPVDQDNRPRVTRGPFITVRGPDGAQSRLPLHSVLQMVRQQEDRRAAGAGDETIESLPTRTYDAGALAGKGGADAGGEGHNCQICMEDFEEGDELRTLPCFHLFHSKCVDQWLKVNSICPTCRHKVG